MNLLTNLIKRDNHSPPILEPGDTARFNHDAKLALIIATEISKHSVVFYLCLNDKGKTSKLHELDLHDHNYLKIK